MANEDGSSNTATFSEMEGPVAELQQEQCSGLITAATAAAGCSATKIKLKLPKLPEEPTDAAVKEFSHICKECGKGFSSGKALGGHMSSAHVQAKDKLKSRRSLLDGESDDEKHMCGICHKEFPSSKSLYGHMRLHPERQWRGMEPPDHPHRMVPFRSARQMLDGGDEDDYGIDGLDFLDEVEGLDADPDDKIDPAEYDLSDLVGSGWGITGRRGQKLGVQTFDFADIADKEEKEMVIRAARELVMLARGPPTPTPVTQVNDASFTPSAESAKYGKFPPENKRSNRLVIYSSSSSSGDDSEETLVVGSLHEKSPADSASSSFGRDLDDGSARIKRMKLDKKTPNEAQQFLTSPQPETYTCTTCNKSFSSHQALGGHRSSHNKVKVHVQNAVEQVDMKDFRGGPFARLPEIERASSDALKVSSDQVFGYLHECELCGKSFPTGQALGGHKRCHYAGASSSAAHSPSTPDGIGGERSERKVHEFDLNAFPVEDGCDNIS